MPSGIGQIVAGKANGSGFAVTPRHVMTAAHVVRGRNPQEVRYLPESGPSIAVDGVVYAEELDAALLILAADSPGTLGVTQACSGDPWHVRTRPTPTSPMLNGTVTAEARAYRNLTGNEAPYLQLHVDQDLESYKGYSGSPVCLVDPPSSVVAILVEQRPKWAQRPGQAFDASNVLWATPVMAAVNLFGLRSEARIIAREPTLPWQREAGLGRILRTEADSARHAPAILLDHLGEARSLLRIRRKLLERSQSENLLAAIDGLAEDIRASGWAGKSVLASHAAAFKEILVRTRGIARDAAQTPLQAACHLGLYVTAVLSHDNVAACSRILYVFASDPKAGARIFPGPYERVFARYWDGADAEIDKKILAEQEKNYSLARAFMTTVRYAPIAVDAYEGIRGDRPLLKAPRSPFGPPVPSVEEIRNAQIEALQKDRQQLRQQCARRAARQLLGLDESPAAADPGRNVTTV
jgi:hypothetical protein